MVKTSGHSPKTSLLYQLRKDSIYDEGPERIPPGRRALQSAELSRLLQAAARLHGLDEAASAQVAATGMIVFDGMPVMAITLSAPHGMTPDNDLALVCPLARAQEFASEELAQLLELNFALLTTMGCAVASSPEGDLQLLYCARVTHFDAERLARKQRSMAEMAATMGPELARMATAVASRSKESPTAGGQAS